MSSIKLKHSGGNSVSIAGPSSNPAANRTINLNDNYAGDGSFVTANSSGNVGIGTSSPDFNCEIEGTGGGTGVSLGITNTGSAPAGINLKSGHGNWSIYNSHSVGDALEFRDESASTTPMIINSSGIVTKAKQPGFTATTNAEYNISGNNLLTYNNVIVNNGNHYNGSTSIFTAPVTGLYYYAFDYYAQTNNTARAIMSRSTNSGSSWSTYRYGCRVNSPDNYVSATTSGVISLNANDQIKLTHEDGIVHINNPFNFFSMHLIG